MIPRLERRAAPVDTALAVAAANVSAILAALLLCGLLFLPFHIAPLAAYSDLAGAAFFSPRGLGYTLVAAGPLMMVGLGTVVAWRSGFAYLGFQGCLLAGAVAATALALSIGPAGLPTVVLPLAIAASFAAGAGWAALVGFARARFGGSEVLVSLMMNYVAALAVQYLVTGPIRDPGDLPQSRLLPRGAWLPHLFDGSSVNAGTLVALGAALVVWWLMRRSVLGFELEVTGLSARAARYAGIAVPNRVMVAAAIAGGLGGMAGALEVLGNQHRLLDGVGEGIGFVGIVTALLGKLTVAGTVVAAVLYGGLGVGGNVMQRRTGLPASVVTVIEAMIVLLVLASDLLRHYRLGARRRRN